jgi:phospholipid transport system transporter-binding protein
VSTRAPTAGLRSHREGEVLHLAGDLDRAAATAAWPSLQPLLAGVRTVDIGAVTRLDSAGLALLVEAMARAAAGGAAPLLAGAPEGLAELRAAYRLDATLAYADAAP